MAIFPFCFCVKWPQAEGAQFTWLKGLQNDSWFCHLRASGLCSRDTCLQWKENWICILLFCFFVGLLVHDSKALAEASEPKMQLHFSVTCCVARSNNSNYWAREKRIIQPALLQLFVEPYSWEVEDDFHSEQTFLWTSSISSSLCMWCLLTPWVLVEIALLIRDISLVCDGKPVTSVWTVRYSWKSKVQ